MRKTIQIRPEVELLESMTLLSTLVLTGSHSGTYQLKRAVLTTKGSGTISPLGHITDSSKSVDGGPGAVTIVSKKGKVFLTEILKPTGDGTFSGTYTITGGTKAFAGDTGSGEIEVSFIGKASRGKYDITYN